MEECRLPIAGLFFDWRSYWTSQEQSLRFMHERCIYANIILYLGDHYVFIFTIMGILKSRKVFTWVVIGIDFGHTSCSELGGYKKSRPTIIEF